MSNQSFRNKKSAAKRKEKRLQSEHNEIEEPNLGDSSMSEKNSLIGLVVERLGDRLLVCQEVDGQVPVDVNEINCIQRSHLTSVSIVPGDRVTFGISEVDPSQGIISNVFPRRNFLERPAAPSGDLRKRTPFKAICSNIDQLVVVLACQPFVPLHTIDRYLVTAHMSRIPRVLLVMNKADLPETSQFMENVKDYYRSLELPLIQSSSLTENGLSDLRQRLAGLTSIFVGQSGVGKSSLINALLPESKIRVGPLSKDGNFGSHTTSNARWYRVDAVGGAIIDSPGVREMAVWHYKRAQIEQGFRDIAVEAEDCKFRDCSHRNEGEQNCAVLRAVRSGKIHPQRFQSYLSMIASCT